MHFFRDLIPAEGRETIFQEETHMKRNSKNTFSTQNLVIMASLIALQIVLSRYLSIQVNETLRISFETVPLALAGMWLGPLGGAVVALVSDLLGTVIYGYGVWFPPIALGPMFFAAACGWGIKYIFRSSLADTRDTWKVILLTAAAGAINAFGIGLVTTTLYQMIVVGKEGAFSVLLWANLLGRLPTKPFVIAACSVLTAMVHRAVYRPVVGRILHRQAA